MLKEIARSSFAQEAMGASLAGYLKLVRRTNRFVTEPADYEAAFAGRTPVIVAMWHGQHLMVPFARPRAIERLAALTSRSADGGAQAAALRRLDITPVRGSGGGGKRSADKGGVAAFREMARLLREGVSVALTADSSRRARQAGLGVVTLARMTGRPIVPVAVATSRRFEFSSWDRAAVGKPYGKGAIVLGPFVDVPEDADDDAVEAARRTVEERLDAAHQRAYALVGGRDPGAGLRSK